ncbi:MAG: hypothetical protein ABI613_05940 [Gemmatimonadota bacterium]
MPVLSAEPFQLFGQSSIHSRRSDQYEIGDRAARARRGQMIGLGDLEPPAYQGALNPLRASSWIAKEEYARPGVIGHGQSLGKGRGNVRIRTPLSSDNSAWTAMILLLSVCQIRGTAHPLHFSS